MLKFSNILNNEKLIKSRLTDLENSKVVFKLMFDIARHAVKLSKLL